MANPSAFEDIDDLGADELRQRLRALQQLIARVPVPIAIAHDRECRFVSANAALADLLQVPPQANVSLAPLADAPLYRIQREGRDIPADELPMQYAIAHRTRVSNEIEMCRADGSVIYIQNDVEPLYDSQGEIYGCVSVCVDVSERKRSEAAFRDDERRKDQFIATLSHELRNPMAPIRTALEVMRLAGQDAAVVEQARMTIERQLQQLARLTDDLLDVSRITQDKLTLRRARIDLRRVLDSAVETAKPAIDAHQHTLEIAMPDTPLWVDADSTRLSQVFSNLLNNAAKFTPPRGRISVHAAAAGGTVTVTVTDNGIGIPASLLPRIFDMFRQLQAFRDRTQGGLGIGLTLARRLLELHGGTIQAASGGIGHGSTFSATLPAAVPSVDEPGIGDRDRTPMAVAARRILVAEDNLDAAEMLRLMLTLRGHEVVVAFDGEEAIAAARRFLPQIAILDIGMPRVDGYELARQVRRALGGDVVLVALTGWGQEDDKRRSREAGFDHHLTKPPELDVLESIIAGSPAT